MGSSFGSRALTAIRAYLAFEVTVIKDAWSRASATFPLEVKRWPQYVLLFACGAAIYAGIKGFSALWDEVTSTVSFGVLGVAVAFLLVLVFDLFAAPYRLWAGRSGHEKAMRDELEALKKASAVRSASLSLAKELEQCVHDGQVLVIEWGDINDKDTSVTRWYARALELVAKLSEGERSMFATLASPPWTLANMRLEREALEARIGKLRLIMGRQFARAEGAEAV